MRAYGKRLESLPIYREAEKTGNVSEDIHFFVGFQTSLRGQG